MKNSRKFPALSAFLIMNVAGVSLFAGSALALDNFFLEIGKPVSLAEVNENWKNLSEKYKKSLGGLTLYPKSIVDEQGNSSHVIQVGAINEKARAQKICNMLFAKNVPCFVIEGIEGKPPTMSVDIARASGGSGSSFGLPWQTVDTAPSVAADNIEQNDESEAEGEEEETPAQAPVKRLSSKSSGDVDVAEAIAVPLSDKNEQSSVKIAKSQSNTMFSSTRKRFSDSSDVSRVSFSSSDGGRLNIGSFVSENEAADFWKYVNDQHPDLAGGLNIMVQKTLSVSGGSKVQLSVGRFASGSAAADFCNQTIADFSSRLKCSYSEDVVVGGSEQREVSERKVPKRQAEIAPASEGAVLGTLSTSHGDAYERRRALALGRASVQQAYAASPQESQKIEINDVESTKKFWVQLAIADSKEEAQYRLKEIKKKNSKAIGVVEEKIAYSPSSVHGKYSAQIGVFANEQVAQDACDKLQQKGVDCLVISKQ